MGFLSYGSGKALSYTHDYQNDIDRLYQRESYRAQVQAEKEKKSMFYASLMKEQTTSAPVNTTKLENFYQGLHKDIADYAINNSDWETNVSKTQEMMSKMDQFINNPIVREDQEVQQQWNATKDAYNKKELRPEEYNVLAEKYHNYTQNGGDPYVFANPKRKEFSESLKEINDYLKPVTLEKTDPKTQERILTTEVSPDKIKEARIMWLKNDPDFADNMQKSYDNISPELKGTFDTFEKYVDHTIANGEESLKISKGYDPLYQYQQEQRMKNQNEQSNYPKPYLDVYSDLAKYGIHKAHPANIAFTQAGKIDGKFTPGIFKVNDPSTKGIVDLNISGGDITAVSSGDIIKVGEVPMEWVQISVGINKEDVALDPTGKTIEESKYTEAQKVELLKNKKTKSQSAEMQSTLLSSELDKYGFKKVQVKSDSGMPSIFGDNILKEDKYVGWTLVPVNLSAANRTSYDSQITGTKEGLSKVYNQQYGEDLNFKEAIQSGSPAVVSSIINQKTESYFSDAKIRNQNFSWNQNSSKPNEFIHSEKIEDPILRKGKTTYIKYVYDYNTNSTDVETYKY